MGMQTPAIDPLGKDLSEAFPNPQMIWANSLKNPSFEYLYAHPSLPFPNYKGPHSHSLYSFQRSSHNTNEIDLCHSSER